MRILLTGGAGFLGSHFVAYLLKYTDAHVTVIDRTDVAGNWDRIAPNARVSIFHCDLRAEIRGATSEKLLRGGPFDAVVHMAAGSHVDRSVKDPLSFVADNVVGSANLLEWVRSGNVLRHGNFGKFLYFSTDEVFGPALPGESFGEWDRFNPTNPYASTKAAAECLMTAWATTYGLPIVISHCANIFGEGQDSEKFIPILIDRISRGQKVLIHSDPSRTIASSRFYIHAENVCSAVWDLLQKGECLNGSDRVGKYNITGEEEVSNLLLAQKIAGLLGRDLVYELVDFVPERPRHDMRYAMSNTALAALGWKPHVSLDEGLKRVIGCR
jgi:dTDP-glucose 4,6-dehydratase